MSKLTEAEIDELKGLRGDNEAYHSKFDDFMEGKLSELDNEWMEDLNRVKEIHDIDFWYA